jgi:hypothetical protein
LIYRYRITTKTIWTSTSATIAFAFVTDILAVTDFEDAKVQRFYTAAEEPFAPQGQGYEVKVKSFGKATYAPGQTCVFDRGFPATLQEINPLKGNLSFKIWSVNDNLSRKGWISEIQARDRLFT